MKHDTADLCDEGLECDECVGDVFDHIKYLSGMSPVYTALAGAKYVKLMSRVSTIDHAVAIYNRMRALTVHYYRPAVELDYLVNALAARLNEQEAKAFKVWATLTKQPI